MSPSPPSAVWRILHLEDDDLDHALVARALRAAAPAAQIDRAQTLDQWQYLLTDRAYDVVLADYRLPGCTALDAWAYTQTLPHPPPFVLVSGAIGERAAVEAIQSGMADFVAKDELGKLPHVVARAIASHALQQAKQAADADLAASQRQLAAFASHLQDGIEDERARIAREIHDDVGGSLAALRFDLGWLQRHTDDTAALERIHAATATLQHAIAASQRIMKNLRPAILDQGLLAGVRWLADKFSQRTDTPVVVRLPTSLTPWPQSVVLTVFRTVQEALTNAAKYAQASQIRIDLSYQAQVLLLEVHDNGVGLAAEQLAKAQSYGLRGLRERARTVGGWLDVSSAPGAGTTLTLSIPQPGTTLSDTDPDTPPTTPAPSREGISNDSSHSV